MIDITSTITIDRSAEEVFAFVADQTNAPQWQQGLSDVRRLTDGPLGVNTEHEFIRRFAGRRVASRNRFVVFEPDHYVGFEIPQGWITGQASYLVEPLPSGSTLLTSRMEFRVHGWAGAFERVLGRALARDSRRDGACLKRVLESPTGAAEGRSTAHGPVAGDLVSVVQRWGWLSGVTGAVANGLLVVMFAQYAVEPDGSSPWVWTGPANDAVGAVSALAGAPMVLALTSLGGPGQGRRVLAWGTVAGAVGLATASVLLLLDRITLELQTAVAVPYIVALFAWLVATGSGSAQRVLPPGQARAARTLGRLVLGGAALTGVGMLMPSEHFIEPLATGCGIALGAVGFLGYPFWQMQVSRSIGAVAGALPVTPTAPIGAAR